MDMTAIGVAFGVVGGVVVLVVLALIIAIVAYYACSSTNNIIPVSYRSVIAIN